MKMDKTTPEQCGAVCGCGVGMCITGQILGSNAISLAGLFQAGLAFLVLCVYAVFECIEISKRNRNDETK